MAFDYSPIAATAASLLAQFGQTVTLSKVTPGTYDPVTGAYGEPATATQTASAALLDYTLRERESGAQFADGSMIRTGDKKCLIEAVGLDWAPDESTTLTDAGGVVWQIENLRTLAPSGVPVLYTANATR